MEPPHLQKRRAKGSGSRSRRDKSTRNSWESMRTKGCVCGQSSASLWNFTRACSPFVKLGNTTLDIPVPLERLPPSSDGVDLEFVQNLRKSMSQGQSAPRRDLETLHTFQSPCHLHCSAQLGCVRATLMAEQVCKGNVALVDHVETVGPTGPECALTCSRGAQPASAQHQRQSCCHAGRVIARFWRDLENLAQTRPQSGVVVLHKTVDLIRADRANQLICSSSSAMQ